MKRSLMHHAKILVVEDEQLVALDIATRLAPLGYSVITAQTGEEAIAAAASERPDLVLMDIRLNDGTDGIEAAMRIRATQDIPIIYLTAYADEATIARAKESEPYGYLLKPFAPRELKATIEMALQRHFGDKRRREQDAMQRFLADASARVAESLDYRTVVDSAAELLVPQHGDSCSISLRPADDFVPALMVIRPDGQTEGSQGTCAEAAIATEQAHIDALPADPDAVEAMLGQPHARVALAAKARCAISAPICARKRVLGAIVLVSQREYDDVQRVAIDDFARRLAIAIDNALLFRQAENAVRMREEILAVVTHDLRAPLGTILLRAQFLERTQSGGAAGAIVKGAMRMSRLIGDLVDAASIDGARLSLSVDPHSAGQLAAEAADAMRPIAEAKSITLAQPTGQDQVRVYCDRGRILQVLSNLIGNAIEHTPNGGSIDVRVDVRASEASFAVHDNGPGIPPEQIAHLFERFWRATPRREGAGLGLYIAKGIVERHGGHIHVDTELGHGSVFTFTLPLAPAAEARA
jgi:signal transduction histidine kinase/CheY-like chemotaxis protein